MATYKQIQNYIKETHGYIPKSYWIAHMKEIYSLNPQEKQEDLRKAFIHFKMI
ncbi:MAG: hypothetical protein FWE02_05535 [Defluviitaleaceae bacterium]|nr:hypothetical protein [Defluviitaleaceae bacterium]